MGRPTKYKAEYAETAEYLCEQLGATDAQIARVLGISEATLYAWKGEHPEFLEAVSRGKVAFDSRNVESSCLAVAQGYWYQEEAYDKDSGQIVRLWKYRHPDIKAIALWMANRRHWRLPVPDRASLPAGEASSGAGAAAAGNALPPGGQELVDEDDATRRRLEDVAREILERRHATRIRVDSSEVETGKDE